MERERRKKGKRREEEDGSGSSDSEGDERGKRRERIGAREGEREREGRRKGKEVTKGRGDSDSEDDDERRDRRVRDERKGDGKRRRKREEKTEKGRSRTKGGKHRKRRRRDEETSGSSSSSSGSGTSDEEDNSGSESSSFDEEERKREKRRREKKKRRKEKRRQEKKEERERRRLLKEAKKFLQEHNPAALATSQHQPQAMRAPSTGATATATAAAPLPQGVEPLSSEDYFSRNPEFSTWLREDRGIFFSSLTSEDSHTIFGDFVAAWNSGRLPRKFYDGSISAMAAPRSSHNWAFRGGGGGGRGGGGRKEVEDPAEEEERHELNRARAKFERKRARKAQEELLDELVPKATGREALVADRKARREEARARREDSPEVLGVRERDLLGGGDEFHARLARQKAWKDRRSAQKTAAVEEKVSAYQAKESEKMEALRAMIAMAGGKITIAKRE